MVSCCVVERRAQALRDVSMSQFMVSKKTLELNPHHRLIRAVQQRVEGGEKEGDSRLVVDLVHLLYDTALLVSGFSLPDPAAYARRIHQLVGLGLGVEGDEQGEEAAKAADKGEAVEGGKKDEPPPLIDEGTVMEEVD
jgi:molecular chaperone HtpG